MELYFVIILAILLSFYMLMEHAIRLAYIHLIKELKAVLCKDNFVTFLVGCPDQSSIGMELVWRIATSFFQSLSSIVKPSAISHAVMDTI